MFGILIARIVYPQTIEMLPCSALVIVVFEAETIKKGEESKQEPQNDPYLVAISREMIQYVR